MKNLPSLFKIVELTRSQVQYGYLLSGVPKDQLSTLAAHHYLVTFIAWQLALNLKAAGANIDVLKVMEFSMIHDLGELMGGDISARYSKVNKKARKFAKLFEEENQKYLSKFFGDEQKRFRKMGKEILDAKSDEALLAKVADYLECGEFLAYVDRSDKETAKFNADKVMSFVRKMKDKTAKRMLGEFVIDWAKRAEKNNYIQILNSK